MSTPLDADTLSRDGLNMLAIFNLADLPGEMRAQLAAQVSGFSTYRQLILLAHGGRLLWERVQGSQFKDAPDPIDSVSQHRLHQCFAASQPAMRYKVIYPPSDCIVPVQTLGRLAGWHHPSPLRIGIHPHWGTWFAYRAVALCDSKFETSVSMAGNSPCESCLEKPCITACPGGALSGAELSLQSCIDYRLKDDSACKARCLSRLACPIGAEHRYIPEQLHYHYICSMRTIEQHFRHP